MEADERGLGVTSTSVHPLDENHLCVESNTRFVLWTGSAEPGASCECYAREASDQLWTTTSVANQVCPVEAE
jgi:hypothetical protein